MITQHTYKALTSSRTMTFKIEKHRPKCHKMVINGTYSQISGNLYTYFSIDEMVPNSNDSAVLFSSEQKIQCRSVARFDFNPETRLVRPFYA